MFPLFKSESGMSIVLVMIAAVLLSAIAAASSKYLSAASKSGRKIESSLDLSGIKLRVIDAVNCTNTMATTNAPANCTTSSYGYLALRDHANRVIVQEDGSTRIGDFNVRARCNPGTSGGIEVRAARLTPAGVSSSNAKGFAATNAAWFLRDEVATNLLYNWEHPKGLLFAGPTGSSAESRLCREFFMGSTAAAVVNCATLAGPGTVMTGYNPVTKLPECSPVSSMVSSTSSCPSGQYMHGMVNGVPQCRPDVVGGGGGGGGGGGSILTFVATGQVCGDGSDDCQRCQDNGLRQCGAAVGDSCSPEGYRCYNRNGCRVFKCDR
jgi:hypothetical protein